MDAHERVAHLASLAIRDSELHRALERFDRQHEVQVERGDECGIERGLYCADGDRCLVEDPSDDDSPTRCYQDCSAGTKCDTGKCVLLGDMFARCS